MWKSHDINLAISSFVKSVSSNFLLGGLWLGDEVCSSHEQLDTGVWKGFYSPCFAYHWTFRNWLGTIMAWSSWTHFHLPLLACKLYWRAVEIGVSNNFTIAMYLLHSRSQYVEKWGLCSVGSVWWRANKMTVFIWCQLHPITGEVDNQLEHSAKVSDGRALCPSSPLPRFTTSLVTEIAQ